MTEQLHDLLTRIADQAGPAVNDPSLWGRARRSRRRGRALRVSAAVVTAAAVIGAVAVGLGTHHDQPPANQTPHPNGAGIPSTVRGIHGNGGLVLESDLAVGPASVAIANQSGAFVVTAADGVYHRLRLPGFDPAEFDENQTGVALSPDGTKLAYGWRAASAGSGSTSRSRIGTRVLDLRTGALQKIPGVPGYFVDSKAQIDNFGFGWSPNGRYLLFETLTKDPADAGPEHWWSGFDTARERFFLFAHEARDNSCLEETDCPPTTLVRPHLSARVKTLLEFTGSSEKALLVTSDAYNITGLPGVGDWAVGRFTPDGRRLLLQPDGLGTGMVLVTDHSERAQPWQREGAVTLLTLDSEDWPDGAKIDVLGWIGPDHALAVVNRGTGADTWEAKGEVVLVDTSQVADGSTGEGPADVQVVGHVEPGDPGSSYSFATDFATVDVPTQDFEDGAAASPGSDPSPSGALAAQSADEGGTARVLGFGAAGLTVVAVLAAIVVAHRRRQPRTPKV